MVLSPVWRLPVGRITALFNLRQAQSDERSVSTERQDVEGLHQAYRRFGEPHYSEA